MIYLDTSVLLAFTLTRTMEPLPLPRREDKIIKARLFSALHDATDLPHAISAHTAGCATILAYDEHFRSISDVIPYRTPDEFLAELARNA